MKCNMYLSEMIAIYTAGPLAAVRVRGPGFIGNS